MINGFTIFCNYRNYINTFGKSETSIFVSSVEIFFTIFPEKSAILILETVSEKCNILALRRWLLLHTIFLCHRLLRPAHRSRSNFTGVA